VATRLAHPGREFAALRALAFAWFNSPLLLDEDQAIAAALEEVDGIDAGALVAALDSPEVTEAYEADKAQARTAAGGPTEFQGKAALSDGLVRYTAPSVVFEADGRRLEAGGFQPLEAYDVLLANLDTTMRRLGPPEGPLELLEHFAEGLCTQEVAVLLADNLIDIDRSGAEDALVDGHVLGHPREQRIAAALASQRGRPELRAVGLPELIRGQLADDPALVLQLAVELTRTPARMAGEHARPPRARRQFAEVALGARETDRPEDHQRGQRRVAKVGQHDRRVGRHRSAAVHRRAGLGERLQHRRDVCERHLERPVEHQAERALVIVGGDQHHGAREVGINQRRGCDQQFAAQRFHRGSAYPGARAPSAVGGSVP
jgi:hypothetical protein